LNPASMRIKLKSMTKRLTIVVPDHVAERAQESGNASKWFSTAGLRLLSAEQYLAAGVQHMAGSGVAVTEDGVRAAGAVLHAAEERMSPEAWAALQRGPQAYREFLAARRTAGADAA
jgi:hypothetical protein